jgi:hypothetical protein
MIDVRETHDRPAKVGTTFATRVVAENAKHMIRKTIYACRMYPIQREPMVSDFSLAAG